VTHSTREAAASPRPRSLRAGSVGIVALVALTIACGRKGPPLAPFVRVPAPVAGATGQRIGNDVYVSFPVPSANADGEQPADIQAVEVYAVTSVRPPQTDEQRKMATLLTTLPVKPILPEPPVPSNVTPPPALPVPPGLDRGATAVVRETLTAEARVPVELPLDEKLVKPGPPVEVAEAIGPLVAPPPTGLPRRHYFMVGVSPRGRKSDPSAPISIPLESGSSAPGAPSVTHTATDMTITWTPPEDARTSTFLLPSNTSATVAAPVLPAPPALPALPAKSLGFATEATTYHVYDVPSNASPEDPMAIAIPSPLTPQPIAATVHVIASVTFGVERCFVVRPVDQVLGATVIGPASPPTCLTPNDTFPPAAPQRLEAITGAGVINLIWEPNTESDLAGYIVLRGEAPGDTLQAITAAPVAGPTYRDETVKPGTRYVYVVVAVDRATPQNVSAQSNRAEETARQ